MSLPIKRVKFGILGEIVNRPESRIKRFVQAESIPHWRDYMSLANGVKIALGMRSYATRANRKVKFRLPVPTLLLAQHYCIEHRCSAETLYRLASEGLMLQLRDTNLTEYSKPHPVTRGVQVQLRKFCPYAYNAMRIAAYAFRTKPSAIMDWALHQYLGNEEAALG